jgi:hypothetical protein
MEWPCCNLQADEHGDLEDEGGIRAAGTSNQDRSIQVSRRCAHASSQTEPATTRWPPQHLMRACPGLPAAEGPLAVGA